MAKFCPDCGNEIENTSKFCGSCGYDLSSLEITSKAEDKIDIKSDEIDSSSVGKNVSPGDVKELIKKLENTDPQVRFDAAFELGTVGGSGLDILHEALNSENVYIRWGAAYALGGIKSPKSLPLLVKSLKTEPETNIKKWMIYALREIDDQEAVGPLLEILARDSIPNGLIRTLGYMGGEKALKALKYETKENFGGVMYAEGEWAMSKILYDLQYFKMAPDSRIKYADSSLKSLNITPAEFYLLRKYKVRDKDDIGEFVLIYTLLDLLVREVLTSEQHINFKEKKKLFGGSEKFLQEFCIIKRGENYGSENLKPHEQEVVSYVKKDKGIDISKFQTIADNDSVGKRVRNKYIKYLANEGYFEKGGLSMVLGDKLTPKGKETLQLFNDAMDEGNDIRIWLKYNPEMAYEYLNNMAGNILLKRRCTTLYLDIPVLKRKINEAKTPQEKLLAYYYICEGPRSDLNLSIYNKMRKYLDS